MVRDLNLMRQIMLDLEKRQHIHDNISALWPNKTIEEYEAIAEHVLLLQDNNYLLLGSCLLGNGFEDWYIARITNDGYTFLDCVRPKSVWQKLLSLLQSTGTISLDVIKPIASEILTDLVKSNLPIDQ